MYTLKLWVFRVVLKVLTVVVALTLVRSKFQIFATYIIHHFLLTIPSSTDIVKELERFCGIVYRKLFTQNPYANTITDANTLTVHGRQPGLARQS